MAEGLCLVIFPTDDVARQTELLRALTGTAPYVESDYYVGFRTGDLEFGIDPNGHREYGPGPICYWQVADLEAAIASLEAIGAEVRQPPKHVGGGLRTAILVDGAGNVLGLRAGSSPSS